MYNITPSYGMIYPTGAISSQTLAKRLAVVLSPPLLALSPAHNGAVESCKINVKLGITYNDTQSPGQCFSSRWGCRSRGRKTLSTFI